jgi:hypothetical protein
VRLKLILPVLALIALRFVGSRLSLITNRLAASGRAPARSAVIRGQQSSGASTGGLLADRTRHVM